jgi:acetyltransferase-like isoleucine patch superfamily enzyme
MINQVKNRFGKFLRAIVIYYYKMMGVSIGEGVFISHRAKIDTTYRGSVEIGDGCYITFGAILLTHDHSVYRHVPFKDDRGQGKLVLGKNVFVGAGAIILRNIEIGDNLIVAAGAVVTKDAPANVVVSGNPASIIKEFEILQGR